MKQKILAVLMIIAVLLCFMPTMAFADGETSASQIGKYYEADDQNSGALAETPSLEAGSTVKKYETQRMVNGQVRIDKTIAGTGTENVFDVTLKVTTEDVDMQTVTSKDAAVVLVIDVSGSMKGSRIESAKEAANEFIKNFKDVASDTTRKVAIVAFSGQQEQWYQQGRGWEKLPHIDGATTILGWTDANSNDIAAKISGLTADGGTDLAAGLQLAKNLLKEDAVKGISNKNIVVLTDGQPTYGVKDLTAETSSTVVCDEDGDITGEGTGLTHEIHTQVEELSKSLTQEGVNSYAVFLGNERLYCDKVLKENSHGRPKKCDLDMSGRQWLATKCGFTAYAASDVEKLADIFKKISELIKYQAQAWILTDPMGEYVDCLTQYTDDDANKGINFNTTTKELSWNLKQAKPTSTKGQQKTYELTYQIKLNNLADNFQAETYYATNKPTSLTYLITDTEPTDQSPLKTAYFNVPSVKGLASRQWSFTKVDETTDGNALAGAEFTLTADDDPSFVLTSTTSGTDGQIIFTNIPSGHTYTLKETKTPAGYAKAADSKVTVSYRNVTAPAISEDGKLANQPETTSVSVTKVWNDADNQDNIRPESVTVQLYADEDKVEGKTIELNEANNWSAKFEGLNAAAEGKVINYTVAEVGTPSGYESTITGSAERGFTITNTHTPATVDISGSKTWNDGDNRDNKRPDSITINLLANGTNVDSQVVTADDNGNWNWTFAGKAKYAAGQEITYTVTENAVDGYTQEINGYNITNTYNPEKTSITITKSWNDENDADEIRPTSVEVEIYAGSEKIKDVALSAAANWTTTVTDLPKNADGTPINYTVKEKTVNGYTSVVTGDAATGFVITNTHEPKKPEIVTISGKKIWDDNENKEGKRPESITVNLKENGQWIATTIVSEATGWTWKFDVPQVEGTEGAVYDIEEEPEENYTTRYIETDNGYDIVNTLKEIVPEEDGYFQLHKIVKGLDPIPEGYHPTFTITGSNGYAETVTYDASMYVGGLSLKAGVYTITESNAAVSGYNCSTTYRIATGGGVPQSLEIAQNDQVITGSGNTATFQVTANQSTIVEFTNSYTESGGYVPTPTPDVYPLTISKQVTGLDTVPADYAVTVTITNKYGTAVRTITLKANDTTTVYLPYGEYTLTETAPAVEGYTQSGQTFSENGFVLTYGGKSVTITNSYTKDADEPTVDPTPTDPATPAEPTKPDDNNTNVPKTGDDMPISLAIYGIIAAGALLGIRKAAKRETK